MRKTAIIGLVAVLVAGWGLAGEAPQATAIEKLVPGNAVAVVQVTSFPELKKAFEQSALAEAVKGSQLLSYFYTVAGAAADFGAVVISGRPAGEVKDLIGGQIGAVLLNFESPQDARQRVPVALLIESKDAKKLEEVVTAQFQLFALLNPALGLSERKQAGATVREIALPKGGFLAYAVREPFVILGSRDSVNTLLAGNQATLAASATYQAVRTRLATQGGVQAYVDVARILQITGAAGNPGQMQKMRAAGISEVKAVGLALDFHGRQVRERFYIHTGGPQTGILKLLTTGAPVAAALNANVPASYTVVAGIALKEVGLWARITQLVTELQGPAAVANIDNGANAIQQQFGIQIKEGFFDTFTDEIVIAADLTKLPEFAGTGRQPKPQEIPFILAAKLSNEAALRGTLDRLAANEKLWEMGVERKAAQHAGADVYTFKIPMQNEIQPSYAIVDKTLLFSIRPEAVKASLDARAAKKGFAIAPLESPAHLRIQLNDGQILTSLLGMIREDVPDQAKRLIPELERLCRGLHGYRAALRREDQGISITAQSDLGTTGTLLVAAVLMDNFKRIVATRVNGDLDSIAAALERYRKAKGAYPASLNELVPDYLPAVLRDRFDAKRAYGYSRGVPDLNGRMPDAWCLTSVGPDEKVDIPVEQFDPPVWQQRATNPTPDELPSIKRVVYQFRKEQYKDEQKNDDEGDIIRMGGAGVTGKPGPAPKPTVPRPKPPTAPPDF